MRHANKGWDPVIYALTFRYRVGTLLEYAIRKEKLLLEIDRSINKQTLINLIATGLPKFVLNRINKEGLTEVEDLYKEINKNKHFITKKTFEKKDNTSYEAKETFEKRKPCKTCERLNKGARYHPDSSCWFKTKEKERENIKCNFKHDFLIGLDMIKDFRLIQNEDLTITQKIQDFPDTNSTVGKYEVNFNENIDEKNFNITVNHLN